MRIDPREPPRVFRTGYAGDVELHDCGVVSLEPGEQVTFVAGDAEHDVARTAWGFYATGSLNARLPSHGLRPALVEGAGKFFVMLVAVGCEEEFSAYLERERLARVCWLDDEDALSRIAGATAGK